MIAGLGLEMMHGVRPLRDRRVDRPRPVLLPHLLDRRRSRRCRARRLTLPGDVTSVRELTGRVPSVAEMAAWLRDGYVQRLGASVDGDEIVPPATSVSVPRRP